MEEISLSYSLLKKYFPVVFFIFGFLFDLLTLGPAGDTFTLIQLWIYLGLCFLIFSFEIYWKKDKKKENSTDLFKKYSAEIFQFFSGALFSAFIFYFFQSASIRSSFIFLIFIIASLLLSEFKKLGSYSRSFFLLFHLSCLCIFSIPIVLKASNGFTFLISIGTAAILYFLYGKFLYFKLSLESFSSKKLIRLPIYLSLALFSLCYFYRIIPPLPLSLKYAGIFHELKRNDQTYELGYRRSPWKFWQHGAQSFEYLEGQDKLYAFFSIYSPHAFSKKVKVLWGKKLNDGKFKYSDSIPIQTYGGRKEGYRGYTVKENFSEGQWVVKILTDDGLELGRRYLKIFKVAHPSSPMRMIIK